MQSQRFKLTIAYRGTHYHGWQWQAPSNTWKGPTPPEAHGIPTIQSILQRAIQRVLGHPIKLVGSSRTDAGVHAKGQIAHFDTDKSQIPTDGLRRAINHKLPDDITVRKIEPVPDWFVATISTVSKRYQYAVWNQEERPTFFGDLVWHRWQPIDLDRMRDAAARFVGEHDFASFCRPGHKRETTVRTVHSCDVSRRGPLIVFGVEGTGFLWNMVRIMVGTIVEVGMGIHAPADINTMLAAKDRRAAGYTAPPHGLYLQWVKTWKPEADAE
jgi:tRNA pseudouridine38-40 synthase